VHRVILAAVTPDNTPHGYNLTFAMPMLLFIIIGGVLYLLLFSRPHRRVPARAGNVAGPAATTASVAAPETKAETAAAAEAETAPAAADEEEAGAADEAGAPDDAGAAEETAAGDAQEEAE
jgi:hypothetical protein